MTHTHVTYRYSRPVASGAEYKERRFALADLRKDITPSLVPPPGYTLCEVWFD